MDPKVLYDNSGNGVKITQTQPETVDVALPLAFLASFQSFLTAAGGQVTSTTGTHANWTLPTNENSSRVLTAMTKTQLDYMPKTIQGFSPLAPSLPSGLAGSVSPTRSGLPSSVGLPSPARAGFPPPVGLPTASPSPSRLGLPPASTGFPPPVAKTIPFSGINIANPAANPLAAYIQGGSAMPSVEHQAKKVIASGQAPDWQIYDYSAASLALFLGADIYQQLDPIIQQNGGKKSKLYPDGPTAKFGYIFAKSNAVGMQFLNQTFGVNVQALTDFSQVKQRVGAARAQQYGAPQHPPHVQMLQSPGLVDSMIPQQLGLPTAQSSVGGLPIPAQQGLAGLPTVPHSSALMGMSGMIPGIPSRAAVSESQSVFGLIEEVVKDAAFSSNATQENADGSRYIIGTADYVDGEVSSSSGHVILWSVTVGSGQKCTKIMVEK